MDNYQTYDYDAVITDDNTTSEYIVLQPGTYDFTITQPGYKTRYGGGSKIPPCNEVDVTLDVVDPITGRSIPVVKRFYLYSGSKDLFPFFESIGLAEPGTQFKMNWNGIVGRTGKVEIDNNTYNGKTYNNVKKFVKSAPKKQWGSFN